MKKVWIILIVVVMTISLAGCGTSVVPGSSVLETAAPSENSTVSQAETTAIPTGAGTVAESIAENDDTHDDEGDYQWDASDVATIALNDSTITVEGDGVVVDGSRATITSAGNYSISGKLMEGQIVVDTEAEELVRLIFNGVEIQNSTSAPIHIVNAEKVMIVLADQTQNTITDGTQYQFENPEEDEPNAALFSAADLTITGSGGLTVSGNFNDGIASKDGLIIAGGVIQVTAADDGIRGKDYAVIKEGTLTIDAGGDGLKSDNEEDATRGYISINGGVVNITSGGDAITAQTDVMITGGNITLAAGAGSTSTNSNIDSIKGIKGLVSVLIEGGTFVIDADDDAVHSNGNIIIHNGEFLISTGDDGMHADTALTINGGNIQITESYEGLESAVITINAGMIHVISSDDGINVAGGVDGSGMNPGMGTRPNRGGRPGAAGQDAFAYSGSYYLYINGGYVVVEAGGDGLDINGAIVMTDGMVLVHGPTEQMNGALDYDGGYKITGGLLVAVGSAGMAQAPDQSSSQYSLLMNLNSTLQAGTLVHIQDSNGEDILTFVPRKNIQSLSFSSPLLEEGETYTIFYGGSSTGTVVDGLYQGGSYSGGTQLASFKVSDIVTRLGSGGSWGGRP